MKNINQLNKDLKEFQGNIEFFKKCDLKMNEDAYSIGMLEKTKKDIKTTLRNEKLKNRMKGMI